MHGEDGDVLELLDRPRRLEYRRAGLEQAGTSSDCQANGESVSYASYELIPAPPVIVPLTVSPGDTITGDVSVVGTTATFLLTNTTTVRPSPRRKP